MAKTKAEHALVVIKAGISAVPIVGGPIASLISDYVPNATQRSVDKAIELLRDELETLGDRVDTETVDKDEFSEFRDMCKVITTNLPHPLKAVRVFYPRRQRRST